MEELQVGKVQKVQLTVAVGGRLQRVFLMLLAVEEA